jgi:Gram-negative bacterial TonB protein C-terminal
MSRATIVLKSLAFALALQQAGAAAAAPRQPIQPWNVDYGETTCAASRNYGSEDKPVALALRLSPVGKVMQIILMRPGSVADAEHVSAAVAMAGHQLKTTALRHKATRKGFELVRINFAREAVEPIRTAPHLDIHLRGRLAESFAIPGIAGVLRELDKCNLDLHEHWNVGEERTGTLRTTATSLLPLHRYVSDRDYPTQAMREHRGGSTQVTLMVDDKGVLKDCMAEEVSGVASLDAQTCFVLLERARFRPATDASGKPVRSVLTTRIRWVMR